MKRLRLGAILHFIIAIGHLIIILALASFISVDAQNEVIGGYVKKTERRVASMRQTVSPCIAS